jgi:hypothetical protein
VGVELAMAVEVHVSREAPNGKIAQCCCKYIAVTTRRARHPTDFAIPVRKPPPATMAVHGFLELRRNDVVDLRFDRIKRKTKMPSLDAASIVLAGVALFAAFVNGALGYGFSSLTVPLALVFYTNRILNPAVVLVEVLINFYVLFINRNGVPAVLKRIFPIVVGLLPGIAVGASILALVHPG